MSEENAVVESTEAAPEAAPEMSYKDRLDAIQNGEGDESFEVEIPAEEGQVEFNETPGIDKTEESDGSEEKPEEAKEEVKEEAAPEVFEIKINGKKYNATKEDLIKLAQMNVSAQERFEEASKMRKISDSLLEAARKDPLQFLFHPELGVDKSQIRESIEKYLAEEYMMEQMSEEEREAVNNKRELERYKQQEAEKKEALERERITGEEKVYREAYEKQFMEALQKVDIPKTHNSVARMANYMQNALKKNVNLSAEDAALLVKEDLKVELQSILKNTNPDSIEALLGRDVANKIRQHDVSKVKNRFPGQSESAQQPTQRKDRKYMSPKEWNNYLDSF